MRNREREPHLTCPHSFNLTTLSLYLSTTTPLYLLYSLLPLPIPLLQLTMGQHSAIWQGTLPPRHSLTSSNSQQAMSTPGSSSSLPPSGLALTLQSDGLGSVRQSRHHQPGLLRRRSCLVWVHGTPHLPFLDRGV